MAEQSTGRLMELERQLAARGVVDTGNSARRVPAAGAPAAVDGAAGIRPIHVSRLLPNPRNIRGEVGDVSELAASIRLHGVLQPLTAEPGPGGKYVLIFGHRRLAAAKRAGLEMVPVDVKPGTGAAKATVLMVAENFHRKDMPAAEKALALGRLRDEYGWSAAGISQATGLAPSTVSRYLALLELDEASLKRVQDGTVGVGQALNAVLDARAQQRRTPAPRGPREVRPRPRASTEAPWFTSGHILAGSAREMCGHLNRPKVGGVACGSCWEAAIRADERRRGGRSS